MIARGLGFALVIVMLLGVASTASAENGAPSKASLKAMGLGDLQVMNDSQASKVRGAGAFAGGLGYAYIGGLPVPPAASINVYGALGTYYSAGANSSSASALVVNGTVVAAPPAITGAASFSYTRVTSAGASWARSF